MFFHRTPRLVQQLYPSLTWSIPTNEKKLYLTFDDGPIPDLTQYVLDTLSQFNVKATFFCVGENLIKHADITKETLSLGHHLGNHTHNHLNGWKSRVHQYIDNFDKCEEQLLSFHLKRKLFRPPYGKIRRQQISIIKQTHQIVMWDVLTGDYSSKVQPKDCLNNSIKTTESGSIVLFHDNLKAEKNLKYTLPRYIEYFLKKGYQFDLI